MARARLCAQSRRAGGAQLARRGTRGSRRAAARIASRRPCRASIPPTTSSTRWPPAATSAGSTSRLRTTSPRAAAGAGVKRIVYLGGLVPGDADSEHLLSRRDTGERLRAGTGPGHRDPRRHHRRPRLRRLRGHARPRAAPAGHGHAALGARQVPAASRSTTCSTTLPRPRPVPATAGGIYDAAGPETLTYEAMMRAIARLAGQAATVDHPGAGAHARTVAPTGCASSPPCRRTSRAR